MTQREEWSRDLRIVPKGSDAHLRITSKGYEDGNLPLSTGYAETRVSYEVPFEQGIKGLSRVLGIMSSQPLGRVRSEVKGIDPREVRRVYAQGKQQQIDIADYVNRVIGDTKVDVKRKAA